MTVKQADQRNRIDDTLRDQQDDTLRRQHDERLLENYNTLMEGLGCSKRDPERDGWAFGYYGGKRYIY